MSKLNLSFRTLRIIIITYYLGVAALIVTPKAAIAQHVDPLLLDSKDSLIPIGYGRRELSSFEKYRIKKEIAKLDQAAKNELDRNKIDSAMKLWYRRLRLTRIVDTKAEIEALGKVGAIAWSENRSVDVRNIANRLIAIQTEKGTDKKLSSSLLVPLATAYEKVRYLDKAAAIYQQILANNKKSKPKTLEKLGELYLGIFDYDNASKVYQKLLAEATSKEQKQLHLKALIEIYHNTEKHSKAIAARKQLIQQYTTDNKNNKIPALEIAIAQGYQTIKQIDKALQAYDRAFKKASDTKQIAIARDASLGKARLHQQIGNTEQAVNTYNKLLAIEQQTYNYYGLINTYDTIGKIYLKSGQKKKAKQSFKLGLEQAQKLNYKVDYFRDRLKSLST